MALGIGESWLVSRNFPATNNNSTLQGAFREAVKICALPRMDRWRHKAILTAVCT